MKKSTPQRELAKALGCSPFHLNAVLRRRVRPSVDLAKKIEANTGTPWMSWFEDSPTPSQPPEAA